ncbi:MAG TPA: hypothetical protein VNX15_03050, partial [Gemmatimonadales bacterium]|nr:hypothetical protein [Gemmatimonadales bacterium]
FSSWNNHSHVYDCTGASCTDLMFGDPSGPNAVTIAPGDGKFTWTAQDLHGAVLNVNGFDTAFALPANTSMSGAVFSPGGDTLFFHGMLSNGGSSTQHLGAVRVSDGAVVHDLSVDSIGFGRSASSTGSVALDPGHPWLYAVVTLPGVPGNTLNRPALVVLDRSTWSVIGVAMAPALSAEAYNDWIFNSTSIVPDPANHHVYVVATDYLYDVHQHHGAIVVFDTP